MPTSQTEFADGAKGVGKNAKNDSGGTGYLGACPPLGTHRYLFTLFALDVASLGLSDGVSRADVEKAMQGHAIVKHS